jgi:membrane protease YdiL (CAAX protease family)
MATVRAFIKRHPLLTYYVLAFAISWGGILLIIAAFRGIPATKEQFDAQLPIAIPAMLGGPSIAGLLLIGLVQGKVGFRTLRARLFKWRVGARWYAVALLSAPLAYLVALLALSLTSPVYLPGLLVSDDKASLLAMGIMGGLMAGIFEELGWTGFAVPRLRLRYNVLTTGLIAGLLWGAWHILSNDVWAYRTTSGTLSPALFVTLSGLSLLLGGLPAYRVLMVWVYDRTQSLLVMMLMHASLTVSSMVLGPLAIAGVPLLIYGLTSAAVQWLLVVGVVLANKGQPLRRQPDLQLKQEGGALR